MSQRVSFPPPRKAAPELKTILIHPIDDLLPALFIPLLRCCRFHQLYPPLPFLLRKSTQSTVIKLPAGSGHNTEGKIGFVGEFWKYSFQRRRRRRRGGQRRFMQE